jgi:hypothetical protein
MMTLRSEPVPPGTAVKTALAGERAVPGAGVSGRDVAEVGGA